MKARPAGRARHTAVSLAALTYAMAIEGAPRAAPDDASDFRQYGFFCAQRLWRGADAVAAALQTLASADGSTDRDARARAFSELAQEARRRAQASASGRGRGSRPCRDRIDPTFLAWWYQRMAEIEGASASPVEESSATIPGTLSRERCRATSDSRPSVDVEHCSKTGIRLCPARVGSRWVLAWNAPCESNITPIEPRTVFHDETGDGIDDVWMFFRDSYHPESPDDYTSYYEWLLIFDGATGAPLLVGHTAGFHGELIEMDIEPIRPGRLLVRRLPLPISPAAEKIVRAGLPTLLAPGIYQLDQGLFRRQ
jgi:hypothetical protein